MAASGHRFEALDLLRGVAALAVVALHAPRPEGSAAPMQHAWLAVDLFFVLSGFVIAHAYGTRLAAGGNAWRFLGERLVRLYPLYLLATLAGALLILDQQVDGAPARSMAQWWAVLGANLLFLPAPPGSADSHLFPAVFPAWSLMWELAANLLFALLAPRLGTRMLGVVLVVGLALLVATGVSYGTLDAGVRWESFWGGGGRVLWSFFAGVALFRLHQHWQPGVRVPDWTLAAALAAALAAPVGVAGQQALAAIGFPLLVLLGATARTTPRSARLGTALGALSYGVYVLHMPAFNLIDKLARALAGMPLDALPAPLALLIGGGATLVVAHVATTRFDTPVRAALRRRRQPGVTTMPAAAP